MLLISVAAIVIPCHAADADETHDNTLYQHSVGFDRADSLWSALPELTVSGEAVTGAEASPVQRLSGKALEALAANSVADAMRYFSGVQLKDYGGVGGVKTLDVRSMGSNHIGVFYDGLPLGNAQNGQIDLGKYSLDNVEDITLYNGQKTRVLQPARDFASSSALYIRSRRPRFKDGRLFGMAARFRTGSFGLVNPSLRADFRISDRVTATLNGEITEANGRYRFRYRGYYNNGALAWDTTATRHNGDIHTQRIEASVYGSPGGGGEWQGRVYFYNSEKGIPGAIVNNVWKTSQRQWDRNFFVQGNWRTALGERVRLLLNGKYAYDKMRYLNPDTTQMVIDNTFRQHELYISAAASVDILPGWDAGVAVDWQWNKLGSNMTRFMFPTRNMMLASIVSTYAWRGLRLEGNILATLAVDHTHPAPPVRGNKTSFHRFSPSLSAYYDIPGETGVRVRAFYKNVFRLPTFNDLYYTDVGNALLRPEKTTQYNLGLTWRHNFAWQSPLTLELTADAYRNLVTDKIVAVPRGTGQYRWMMLNIGEVHITGLDLSATGSILINRVSLHARITYTWQQALDYSNPSDTGWGGTYKGQIAYIPPHSGSATLRGEWQNLHFGYSWIYVGKRWMTSANIKANSVDAWNTHDLTIGWRQPIGRTSLDLTAEINNLLDAHYDVIHNYPMPGRNFKIVLSLEL